jgi:carboxyl-terminal processing protease
MLKNKSFWLGLAVGLLVMASGALGAGAVKKELLWRGQELPDTKIREVLTLLEKHSINDYDRDTLIENMYRGLLDGVGDPYTYYFDEEALESFTVQTEGIYAGVGMVVTGDTEDRVTTIVAVYPKTPAERAGLQPGDKIIGVNGVDVTTHQLEEVTALTKGRPGTKVTLKIYRPLDEFTFEKEILRESISIPTVSHKVLDGDVGYLRIEQFERVTLGQFNEAYTQLTEQPIKGLVIDVRNNPGGLLETVTQIADVLLPQGTITYTENKNGEKKYYNSEANHTDLPIVLLVTEGSASASEVLCGAVRDMGRGVLVGTKTFGKGIVQNLYGLSDGSAIKVTVAKYYTPNGICIQGEGLLPDYVVEVDREAAMRAGSLALEDDAQLLKAIEVAREKAAHYAARP